MISEVLHYGRAAALSHVGGVVGLTSALLREYRVINLPSGTTSVRLPPAGELPLGGPIAVLVNPTGSAIPIVSVNDTGTTLATLTANSLAIVLLSAYDSGIPQGGNWRFMIKVAGVSTFTRASRDAVTSEDDPEVPTITCQRAKYKLTNCADEDEVIFTDSNLTQFAGLIVKLYPTDLDWADKCWEVELWDDISDTEPVPVFVSKTNDIVDVFDNCSHCLAVDPNKTISFEIEDLATNALITPVAYGSVASYPGPLTVAAGYDGDLTGLDEAVAIYGPVLFRSFKTGGALDIYSTLFQVFATAAGTLSITGSHIMGYTKVFFPIKNGLIVPWNETDKYVQGVERHLTVARGDLIDIGLLVDPAATGTYTDATHSSAGTTVSRLEHGTTANAAAKARAGQILSAALSKTLVSGKFVPHTVQVFADPGVPWRFSNIPTWMSITPRSGTGPAVVIVDATAAPTPAAETYIMKFTWTATVIAERRQITKDFVFINSFGC